jgi:hypothetical protein
VALIVIPVLRVVTERVMNTDWEVQEVGHSVQMTPAAGAAAPQVLSGPELADKPAKPLREGAEEMQTALRAHRQTVVTVRVVTAAQVLITSKVVTEEGVQTPRVKEVLVVHQEEEGAEVTPQVRLQKAVVDRLVLKK